MHNVSNQFDVNSFQKSNVLLNFALLLISYRLVTLSSRIDEKSYIVFLIKHRLIFFIWCRFDFVINGLKKWTTTIGRK